MKHAILLRLKGMKYKISVEQIALTNIDKNVVKGEWKFDNVIRYKFFKVNTCFVMGWNAATFRTWHKALCKHILAYLVIQTSPHYAIPFCVLHLKRSNTQIHDHRMNFFTKKRLSAFQNYLYESMPCYLSNRPHLLWVYRRDNPREMLGEHEKSL